MSVFGKCSSHIRQYGTNNNTLKGNGPSNWCSAFGKTWIDSLSKDIIEWDIEIQKNGSFSAGHIGFAIVSNYHKQDVNATCNVSHCYYFGPTYNDSWKGYFTVDGKTTDAIDKLHRPISQGDVIHFILDMSNTKFSYYLNNEKSNEKVLTTSVKKGSNIKYALAISMSPFNNTCCITVEERRGACEESKQSHVEFETLY